VILKDSKDGRHLFEAESLQGKAIRGDLARSVVESGWNLYELRPVALSLEEVFLSLTSTDIATPSSGAAAQ
jgi:ABC-2 type transport system ATP-binding protein